MPGSILSRDPADTPGTSTPSPNASPTTSPNSCAAADVAASPATPASSAAPVSTTTPTTTPVTPDASVSTDAPVSTRTAPAQRASTTPNTPPMSNSPITEHVTVASTTATPTSAKGRIIPHAVADTAGTVFLISPSCAAVTLQGRDHYRTLVPNQDAFAALPDDGIFVVSDGHGEDGALLAIDAVNFLVSKLVDAVPRAPANEALKPVLLHAFAATAEHIDRLPEADCSGATMSVAILRDGMLTVANVGDSCVFLAGPDVARRLSVAHKGLDEAEAGRVEEAGGCMMFGFMYTPACAGRKAGSLAITRAFGDKRFVGISRVPDITQTRIEEDQIVVMASDGVWDAHASFKPSEVCKMVIERARGNDPGEGLRRAADAVVNRSRSIPNDEAELPDDDLTLLLIRSESVQRKDGNCAQRPVVRVHPQGPQKKVARVEGKDAAKLVARVEEKSVQKEVVLRDENGAQNGLVCTDEEYRCGDLS